MRGAERCLLRDRRRADRARGDEKPNAAGADYSGFGADGRCEVVVASGNERAAPAPGEWLATARRPTPRTAQGAAGLDRAPRPRRIPGTSLYDAGRDRTLGAKRLADAHRAGRGRPPR